MIYEIKSYIYITLGLISFDIVYKYYLVNALDF